MRKKTAVLLISFLSAASLAFGILAFTGIRRAERLEYFARANSEHAFEELVTGLSELSDCLEKSVYITDPALQSALCTQVYGRSVLTQMAIGMLPYESWELEQTSGFVSRVGDYACVLSRSVGGSGGYSEQELENLLSLSETASDLAQNLQELRMQINNGTMQMDMDYVPYSMEPGTEEAVSLSGSIADIENEFPELPSLIYDGPFSDGIRRDDPTLLQGLDEVTQEQAAEAAAWALSIDADKLTPDGECAGDIPCWRFTANLSGGFYTVQVTKRGGCVLSVLCARGVESAGYSVQDGLAIAEKYLQHMGFENMRSSYHVVQDGVLTVNFEYVQDDVLCYPDLVKIGIALDNGSLVTYDALGYISAHRSRELPSPEFSVEQARSLVSSRLSIDSENLALIPTDGGEEKLCYEFVCSGGAHRCILYVNALTGAQERVLLLLEDESGALTV